MEFSRIKNKFKKERNILAGWSSQALITNSFSNVASHPLSTKSRGSNQIKGGAWYYLWEWIQRGDIIGDHHGSPLLLGGTVWNQLSYFTAGCSSWGTVWIGGVSTGNHRAASRAQCRGQSQRKIKTFPIEGGRCCSNTVHLWPFNSPLFPPIHLTGKLNNGPRCYKEKPLDSNRQQLITVIWYQFINLGCTLSKLFFLFPFHW